MTRDVDSSVMVPFDPESECCFCPRGRLVFSEPAVYAEDHTVKEPGPWDPKSLDMRGL